MKPGLPRPAERQEVRGLLPCCRGTCSRRGVSGEAVTKELVPLDVTSRHVFLMMTQEGWELRPQSPGAQRPQLLGEAPVAAHPGPQHLGMTARASRPALGVPGRRPLRTPSLHFLCQ